MQKEPIPVSSAFGQTDSRLARCLRNSASMPMPWYRGTVSWCAMRSMVKLRSGAIRMACLCRSVIFQTSGAIESREMIRAYIVEHDIGFAPNPFFGVCTLATCKPEIRKHAAVGEWIVGIGSAADGIRGQMVYAMQVEEKLDFCQYWDDDRFQMKKPNFSGSLKQGQGDNVYHWTDGKWVQERSRHTHTSAVTTAKHKRRDTKSDVVLISNRFVYYGADAMEIPAHIADKNGRRLRLDGSGAPKGRFQRWANFSDPIVTARFVEWLEDVDQWGCVGEPCEWRKQNTIRKMLNEQTYTDP